MKLRSLIVAAGLTVTALVAVAPAQAGIFHHRHHHRHHHYHHR